MAKRAVLYDTTVAARAELSWRNLLSDRANSFVYHALMARLALQPRLRNMKSVIDLELPVRRVGSIEGMATCLHA